MTIARWSACLLVLAARVAWADDDRANLDVDAGGVTGTTLSEASVGAAIEAGREWTVGDRHAYARASGSAALRAGSDGVGATIREAAASKPYDGLLFPFEVGERAALDVAPSLSDRRDRWRRRYMGAGIDFAVTGATGVGERKGAELVRVAVSMDWERQRDGDEVARRFVESVDMVFLGILKRHPDGTITHWQPFAMEARGISSGHSGAIVTGWLLRVLDEPFAGGKLDVMGGFSGPGEMTTTVDNTVVSHITSTELPNITIGAARVHWAGELSGIHTDATAEHTMYLGMESTLVDEYRASLQASMTIDHMTWRASGFAARSEVWTSKTTSSRYVTGGGAVGFDLELADHWKLTNQAELARTFYASLDGDRTPHADTALQFDVALHKQLRNWVPH